ncbi:MAG: TonB-dependent receptor [Bacteroidia bacterium]
MRKFYLVLALFNMMLMCNTAFAQRIVEGTVRSALNKQPVAFATVIVEEDNAEIYADIQGRFRVEISEKVTKIGVGSSGFLAKEVPVTKESQYIVLDILLEENELELKTQVVTANRVEENLQVTPVSASVIQGINMQNRSVNVTTEALAVAPNVITDSWTPGMPIFSIRGFSTNLSDPGIESAVGLYIDDVYYSRGFGFNSLLMDIDRLEVLRGPQGTLFGKNTVGGLVNIVTEKPQMQNSAGAELNIGNLGFYQAKAKGNFVLINNKLAGRVTAAYSQRDGFVTELNDTVDNATNRTKFYGVRGNLIYTPTRNVTIDVSGFYSADRGMENSMMITSADGAPTTLAYYNSLNFIHPIDHRKSNMSTGDGYVFTRDQWGASARAKFQLGKNSLNAVTSYYKEKDYYFGDLDVSPMNIGNAGRTQSLGTFSQELRYSTPRDQKWAYIVGLHFIKERIGNRDTLEANDGFTTIPGYSEYYNGGGFIDNTNIALFTSHSYEVVKNLRVNGGIRVLSESKRLNLFQNPIGQYQIVAAYVAAPLASEKNMHTIPVNNVAVTGNFGLDYKVNENVFTYANYTRGFRGAGFNMVYSLFPYDSNLVYKPEFVNNYEIGVKTQFKNRYRVNGNVFFVDYANKQELLIQGTRMFVANAQKVNGWGIEVEGSAILAKGFALNFSAAKLNMKYTEFIASQEVFVTGSQGQDSLTGYAPYDLSGNRVIKAPDYTASLGLEYSKIVGPVRLLARADWIYTGFSYNDIRNRASIARMPANQINMRLGVSDKNGRYGIALWAKNLTNAAYAQHGWYILGLNQIAVNPGRTFGVELKYNFYQ